MIACHRDTGFGKDGQAALSRNYTDSWSGPDLMETRGFARVHELMTGITGSVFDGENKDWEGIKTWSKRT